jgi:hypothetical protein
MENILVRGSSGGRFLPLTNTNNREREGHKKERKG